MAVSVEQPRTKPSLDEAIETAARGFFAAGLCCVVEVESGRAGDDGWQATLLVFRSARPARAVEAVLEERALAAGAPLRLAGWDPRRWARVAEPPPAIFNADLTL